jgi:hypothetical protein
MFICRMTSSKNATPSIGSVFCFCPPDLFATQLETSNLTRFETTLKNFRKCASFTPKLRDSILLPGSHPYPPVEPPPLLLLLALLIDAEKSRRLLLDVVLDHLLPGELPPEVRPVGQPLALGVRQVPVLYPGSLGGRSHRQGDRPLHRRQFRGRRRRHLRLSEFRGFAGRGLRRRHILGDRRGGALLRRRRLGGLLLLRLLGIVLLLLLLLLRRRRPPAD